MKRIKKLVSSVLILTIICQILFSLMLFVPIDAKADPAVFSYPLSGYTKSSGKSGFIPNRSISNSNGAHMATDCYSNTSRNVYPVYEGTVKEVQTSLTSNAGRYIIIQHSINGITVYSEYQHLASINVSKGAKVTKSTVIAKYGGSGKTENQYSPHLHYEIFTGKCNPWTNSGRLTQYAYNTEILTPVTYNGTTYYNPDAVIKGKVTIPGVTDSPASNLEFRDVTCPVNYKVGSSGGYTLSGGILVSNEDLKTITSTIKKADGTIISGPKTRNISGKAYSIASLDTMESGDNGVHFSWIKAAGNYIWVLTATDANKSLTLEMPFTASSNTTTSHNISISYPGGIAVTGVTLDKTSITLAKGATTTLIATVSPSNAANKNVTWSSKNQSVATVDENGMVKAVAPGTTTITVTTVSGGKTATCTITVPDDTVLEFRNVTCPVNYKVGTKGGYILSGGTLVSNEELKTITSTIKKSDGTVISGPKTRNISGKSYNIKSLDTMESSDNGVHFSWIKTAGNYVWVLTATNASKTLTLEMPFTASSSATSSHNVTKPYVLASSVELNKKDITLTPGTTEVLAAIVLPDDAINKNVTWSSNNQSVATVNENGLVTAVAPGTATITVTTTEGGKTATCMVTVSEVPIEPVSVTGVTLNKTRLTLKEKETETLSATVVPSNAENKNIIWSSNDSSVVKVDADGKVTAIKAGQAIITVATEDGGKTATCMVTVSEVPIEPVSVTGVTLNKINLTLKEKETETLSAMVIPSNAYNQKITWSSSDSNVAKVDANGKVTALKEGQATITVATEDGGKTATCMVTVAAAPVAVTSVKLNKTSIQITEDETLTLTATIAPSNADNKKITWTSSDSNVAKVDAKGKVTAMKYGKATITVTTEDGKKTATCTVMVDPADKVAAFVVRCYRIILGREADEGGMKTWLNELNSGRKAASEIIDRFVNSPEFQNKKYKNGEAVDILYKAMLNRNADPNGREHWVDKLKTQPFGAVINGFCFSEEFKGLCKSYGIRAGFVELPNNDTTTTGKIRAFVQRCYRLILDREADPSGMETWSKQLSSGNRAAAEIIDEFVNSDEFKGKKYSNSESVEILYKAMLGRGSDAKGKVDWINKLEAGQPFAVVINGFCVSSEFKGICNAYGIKPGTVLKKLSGQTEEELSMLALNAKEPITKRSESNPTRVEIINPSDTIDLNIGTAVQAVYINEEKAKEFISRCYQCILGREASAAELDNWIGQMTNGTKTPDQIARGFLFSNEFKGKNVSNEDLVKILYKVYMNRDADPEGLKTWTEKLDGGTELKAMLDAFAKTSEFKKVVNEMSK